MFPWQQYNYNIVQMTYNYTVQTFNDQKQIYYLNNKSQKDSNKQ